MEKERTLQKKKKLECGRINCSESCIFKSHPVLALRPSGFWTSYPAVSFPSYRTQRQEVGDTSLSNQPT